MKFLLMHNNTNTAKVKNINVIALNGGHIAGCLINYLSIYHLSIMYYTDININSTNVYNNSFFHIEKR
jgi:Cft2 family RNA processing exonuclease